jgi:prepilin-type processing-associated H-X9-DG protein
MRPARSTAAFTLLELILSITIIGLLAALLLPTLTRTKNKSKSAKCQAHMRQIATAAHLYADEHGDAFALLVRNGRTNSLGLYSNSGFTWWTAQLKPYVANSRVYKCPSQKTDYGIGMNHSEIGLWNSGRTLFTDVAHPDATAVFADCGTGSFVNTNTFTSTNSMGIVTSELTNRAAGTLAIYFRAPNHSCQFNCGPGALAARHDRRLNAAFLDGHIESTTSSELGTQFPFAHPRARWDKK